MGGAFLGEDGSLLLVADSFLEDFSFFTVSFVFVADFFFGVGLSVLGFASFAFALAAGFAAAVGFFGGEIWSLGSFFGAGLIGADSVFRGGSAFGTPSFGVGGGVAGAFSMGLATISISGSAN